MTTPTLPPTSRHNTPGPASGSRSEAAGGDLARDQRQHEQSPPISDELPWRRWTGFIRAVWNDGACPSCGSPGGVSRKGNGPVYNAGDGSRLTGSAPTRAGAAARQASSTSSAFTAARAHGSPRAARGHERVPGRCDHEPQLPLTSPQSIRLGGDLLLPGRGIEVPRHQLVLATVGTIGSATALDWRIGTEPRGRACTAGAVLQLHGRPAR
jgi:hypothetical protein